MLSGDQRKEMILPRPKLDPPASQPEQIRLAAKPAIGPAAQVAAEKEARLLTSQTEQAPNSSLGAYEKVVSGSAGRLAQPQQAPLGKAPDKAFPQTASGPAVAGTAHIGENAADKKPPSSLPGIGAAGRIPVPYEENEPEIYLPYPLCATLFPALFLFRMKRLSRRPQGKLLGIPALRQRRLTEAERRSLRPRSFRKKQPERSLKAADRQRRRSRPGKRLGFSPSGKRGSVWWERRFAPI